MTLVSGYVRERSLTLFVDRYLDYDLIEPLLYGSATLEQEQLVYEVTEPATRTYELRRAPVAQPLAQGEYAWHPGSCYRSFTLYNPPGRAVMHLSYYPFRVPRFAEALPTSPSLAKRLST